MLTDVFSLETVRAVTAYQCERYPVDEERFEGADWLELLIQASAEMRELFSVVEIGQHHCSQTMFYGIKPSPLRDAWAGALCRILLILSFALLGIHSTFTPRYLTASSPYSSYLKNNRQPPLSIERGGN